ncbi:cysteine desulfurase NifS [Candidatus Borrarchaeum sp.]|uniref:cysteine desulfurase NifS n=1 Tax=Candidatus Borrarchaeum sp. TaxID=2846742 RepID=UPI00257EF446|nr:cysteine desulfurase NifS [Candidatus Borrarchaeum sp.]
MKVVYMDNASTTPVDPRVAEVMHDYFVTHFGNASSIHEFGREAREAIDNARQVVAKAIGAEEEEIIFTSGGTEADNLALKGIAFSDEYEGKHIITSVIEHPAILKTAKFLEKQGFEVTYLPVDSEGLVSVEDVQNAIRPDTILISVMYANNEIGTVQPLEEISKLARENNIVLHTDAVQAIGKLDVDINKLGVDLLSMSSHKIHGPKGVGFLYIRKGTVIEPLLHGGGHEYNLRSGTENVPGIVGFAKAMELATTELDKKANYMMQLRDKLIDGVLQRIKGSYLNGHRTKRLPNNANFRFDQINGEALILDLDMNGISASTGSACSSHETDPSHVLLALGLSHNEAEGSLRLTLSTETTEADINYVLEVLPNSISKLHALHPRVSKTEFE